LIPLPPNSVDSVTHHLVKCSSSTTDGGVIKAVVEASKTWNYHMPFSEEETKCHSIHCTQDESTWFNSLPVVSTQSGL
jgi:hypothetical protein